MHDGLVLRWESQEKLNVSDYICVFKEIDRQLLAGTHTHTHTHTHFLKYCESIFHGHEWGIAQSEDPREARKNGREARKNVV